MATKLLLDFDGVVLKNKKLMQYQCDWSARYLHKHTGMPIPVAKDFNAHYYPRYGHTVTMMRKMLKKNVTIEDYNSYMYGDNIRWLNRFVDKDTYEHGNGFNKVFKECEERNIEVIIFTNVDIRWVLNFSNLLDIPVQRSNVVWPSHLDLLKPSKYSYDLLESVFPSDTKFIFFDDSYKNIENAKRPRWTSVLFENKHTAQDVVQLVSNKK
jgi:FMN phosphatase YigB (HAD superfamily)